MFQRCHRGLTLSIHKAPNVLHKTPFLRVKGVKEPPYTQTVEILQQSRQRMVELLEELGFPEGAWPSNVSGVNLIRTTRAMIPVPVMYEPCIVIVAQGMKRFHMPDRVIHYDTQNYLVLTVPVPGDCETVIDASGPFLAMSVRIDLALLSDLLLGVEGTALVQKSRCETLSDNWVSAPAMTPTISNVAVRLLECLRLPMDAKVLGPQLVRELTYRILCGEDGGALKHFLLAGGAQAHIHRILHRMHAEYASPLDIPSLAQGAGMSVSALHAHFKAVTATSPMQYVKTIRLHKARMLMVQDALGASSAAERVGYGSPSQFSREFKRLFGFPPADEAQRVRATFGLDVRSKNCQLS